MRATVKLWLGYRNTRGQDPVLINRDYRSFRQSGRVTALVRFFQTCDRDVGVNLGRLQAAMAEHELDVPKVASIFQQARGEGVPEKMATAAFADGGFLNHGVDPRAEPIRGHAFAGLS